MSLDSHPTNCVNVQARVAAISPAGSVITSPTRISRHGMTATAGNRCRRPPSLIVCINKATICMTSAFGAQVCVKCCARQVSCNLLQRRTDGRERFGSRNGRFAAASPTSPMRSKKSSARRRTPCHGTHTISSAKPRPDGAIRSSADLRRTYGFSVPHTARPREPSGGGNAPAPHAIHPSTHGASKVPGAQLRTCRHAVGFAYIAVAQPAWPDRAADQGRAHTTERTPALRREHTALSNIAISTSSSRDCAAATSTISTCWSK